MKKLPQWVVIGLFLLSVPAVWADDAPASAASAAQAPGTAPAESAAPAAAADAPTEPQLIGFDKVNSGDTAWMLTSTALVLMMCVPGLALFYGGMVRKKNVLATLMQSFACTCLVTILWWLIGYSWAFTPGNGFIGGTSRVLFGGIAFIASDAGNKLTVSH